ncbi:helix-turn-helix domain-containing protein [Metabacillus herbersteinensis]|uniref:Helix-turn-helix domain-containing protein n=1 Tax=Metabacillus herbersteinensis TaxID=283816 RepID=A0ABV6GD09_9BACI
MDYLNAITLYCFQKFNGERSESAIFHLLTGKKSAQTIQDCKLFELSDLFSLFPELTREELHTCVNSIIEKNFLEHPEPNRFLLTNIGEEYLSELLSLRQIPFHLNGWENGDIARFLWRRLSLMVQVLSHFSISNTTYLPLTKKEEDLKWIKEFFRSYSLSKELLNDELYRQLHDLLSLCHEQEASIFVLKLSSSERVGLTYDQLAVRYKTDKVYIKLLFWNVIHFMVKIIQSETREYPLLYHLIADKVQRHSLTTSSATTLSFLLQGRSIAEVSAIRNLKENTIEDHIVEIALHDESFDITSFLLPIDYTEIKSVIEELKTHQLKKIKERLNNHYTYFQIRLAFAIHSRRRE